MNPPEDLLPPPPPPPPPPPNRNGGNPTPPSSSLGFTFSLTEPDGGEVGPENDLRVAVCVWFAQHVMLALAEMLLLSLILRDCEPEIDGCPQLCPRSLPIGWCAAGRRRSELGADIVASGSMAVGGVDRASWFRSSPCRLELKVRARRRWRFRG